jgi:phospholipid transport system substrate-binding protein
MKRVCQSTLAMVTMLLLCMAAPLQAGDDEETLRKARDVTDRVLQRFNSRRAELKANPGRIPAVIADIIKPVFDFSSMAGSAMGKHWRKASAAQKRSVTEAFGNLLMRTYGLALLNYTGKPVEYGSPQRSSDNKRVVIPSSVVPASGRPISIRYYMKHQGGEWRVYDVKIDGVSLMANYRENFNSEIRKSGIDGLIRSLNQRAAAK